MSIILKDLVISPFVLLPCIYFIIAPAGRNPEEAP